MCNDSIHVLTSEDGSVTYHSLGIAPASYIKTQPAWAWRTLTAIGRHAGGWKVAKNLISSLQVATAHNSEHKDILELRNMYIV